MDSYGWQILSLYCFLNMYKRKASHNPLFTCNWHLQRTYKKKDLKTNDIQINGTH